MKVTCIICNKKRKCKSLMEELMASSPFASYTCPKCVKKAGSMEEVERRAQEHWQNKRNFSLN